MGQKYRLTLPIGQIHFKNNLWIGSQTTANFLPWNPEVVGGWKTGDTLQVMCAFDLNPNITPLPPATEYQGLVVGALNNPTAAEIRALKQTITGTWSGGTVQAGITTNSSPGATDIFYNATSLSAPPLQLTPSSRGTLPSLVYEWTMTYNASGNFNPNGIELVFGYGDPMDSEVQT